MTQNGVDLHFVDLGEGTHQQVGIERLTAQADNHRR